jgi:hypothetical protein
MPRPALYRLLLPLAAAASLSANIPFKLKSKDMVSKAYALTASKTITIESVKHRDPMVAQITLDKAGQAITDIKMSHDDRDLLLPVSAFNEIQGPKIAWLEKRGALLTLMLAGEHKGKVWKLALEFHPKQLWKRRLSVEGVRRDEFTFYDRDDMEPSKPEHRDAMTMGLDLESD